MLASLTLQITGRTEAKYSAVVRELSAHCKVSGEALDLDSFDSIKSLCDRVLSTYPKLDAVILNAGICAFSEIPPVSRAQLSRRSRTHPIATRRCCRSTSWGASVSW